jgi:hypothetical protein
MAFSRGLIQGLINPSFGSNLATVGEQVGSAQAVGKQRRMLTDLLGPALDPMATPEQLRQSASQALSIGQQDLAIQLGGMAAKAGEKQKLEAARKNLETAAIAKAGANTEIASALTGADIPTLREYLMGQSEPYTLGRGEIRFRGSEVIAKGADLAPDIGTTISEWINPANPNEVVYQTVQSKTGQTLQLGSNTPLTQEQLSGLQKKAKPSTSISVSTAQKADEAYAVEGAKGLAKQDLDFIARGETALTTLDNIAEARLIFSKVDAKDVLGFAAKEANTVKRAFLGLAGALGVSEDSALYQSLAAQTTAADLVTTFTQDFVRPRMEATKGSITEREFETFMASVPNLLQTEGGYKAVLGMLEKAATAHILRSSYLQENMQTGAAAQAARDKWSDFSRQFPKSSISNTAMRDLWSDFKQDGFDRSKAIFEFNRPDNQGRTRMTFKDIRDLAAENNLHPMIQLRKLFDSRNAAYVPSSAISGR